MSTFLRDQLQGMRINRIKSRVREAWSKRQRQHKKEGECNCWICQATRAEQGRMRVVNLSELLGGAVAGEEPDTDPGKKLQ